MLDISDFRDNANVIKADHDKRGLPHDNIDEVIKLDDEWRKAVYEQSLARKERNDTAKLISDAKKSGNNDEMQKLLSNVKSLGNKIDELDKLVTSPFIVKKRILFEMTHLISLFNSVTEYVFFLLGKSELSLGIKVISSLLSLSLSLLLIRHLLIN